MIAAGAVPLLVALLRSEQSASVAAGALSTLAEGSRYNQDAITAAGAVPLLVAMLRSDQPEVLLQAALALRDLAESSEQNRDAIIAAGALPLLTALSESDVDALAEFNYAYESLVKFSAAEVLAMLIPANGGQNGECMMTANSRQA